VVLNLKLYLGGKRERGNSNKEKFKNSTRNN
jgi:hypothetical protein